MKRKVFPASGGEAFEIEDLEWMQTAAKEAINGLATVLGTSGTYRISGVVDNGTTISDGWIFHNGELLRFVGGDSHGTVSIVDEEINADEGDWEKYATPGLGGSEEISFSSIQSIPMYYKSEADDNAKNNIDASKLGGQLPKEYKTFRDSITISPSGSAYTIPDGVDVIGVSDEGQFTQIFNVPDPVSNKNRTISIYTDVSSGSSQAGVKFNDKTKFYYNNNSTYLDGDGLYGWHQVIIQSDGNKWIVLAFVDVLVACPYVYINGQYYDEILRNHLGQSNDKVDELDITEVTKSGNNTIKLAEEKQETTYMHYFELIIDGRLYKTFIDEDITLKEGDSYKFNFEIEDFDSVKLRAKGYYLNR